LAQQADVVIPLHAGKEATVATCTYVNTLAASLTVARALIDQPVPMDVWESTADAMEAYLSSSADDGSSLGDWPQLGGPLIIVGRGPSTASAWTAALVLKEGAKVAAEGLTAAAFRHGPLELADERLVVFILEGQRRTAAMNERLASDLLDLGAHVTWVGQHPHAGTHNFQLPSVAQLAQPIVETLPFQLLSVSLARRNGFEAGAFRNQAKVTTVE
jgi:glucosamine--fructose-6-phosphate aminotransferase (isomerizing)